jgi:Family of unknown function (DUF5681)
MTEPPYRVGYGRPPVHGQFQKGQSGNPGGKAGPEKLLKHQLEAALGDALNGDEETLRQTKPTNVIESLARNIVLNAVEGRASAQRLVFSILEREGRGVAAALTQDVKRPPAPT